MKQEWQTKIVEFFVVGKLKCQAHSACYSGNDTISYKKRFAPFLANFQILWRTQELKFHHLTDENRKSSKTFKIGNADDHYIWSLPR